MAQSTLIALVIVIAWLLFITARGRLPAYMAVFGLTQGGTGSQVETKSPGDTSAAGSSSGGTGFSPTVPFGSEWWKNFLRPWQG